MHEITVRASKEYTVAVGRGILDSVGARLLEVTKPCRALVVSDKNVAPLYLDRVVRSLEDAGFMPGSHIVNGGEGSKSVGELEALLERLAADDYTRSDIIVALGGGVVGDLSGFAASIYLRGINFVGLPTTLLAAVDSSVGGKTAVNLAAGKNLAGTFWQPVAVYCDCDTFSTLPSDVYADGLAESLKYGILTDKELFYRVAHTKTMREDDVARCVEIKRRYVEGDEFDRGKRAFLNLGHTFAHAIEKVSDFSVSHGHAVAAGMAMAARAAHKVGLCCGETVTDIKNALTALCLPIESGYDSSKLASAAGHDKKRSGDTVSFIFPKAIGECIIKEVDISKVAEVFAASER